MFGAVIVDVFAVDESLGLGDAFLRRHWRPPHHWGHRYETLHPRKEESLGRRNAVGGASEEDDVGSASSIEKDAGSASARLRQPLSGRGRSASELRPALA